MKTSRACMDIMRSVLNSSKLDAKEKSSLAALGCNAIWTKVRAEEHGYVLPDNLCSLCGVEADTVHHRLWQCKHPEVVALRNKHTSKDTRAYAQEAGPVSALYNRGIMSARGDQLPCASEDPVVVCETWKDGIPTATTLVRFKGDVFVDGSCDQHPIKELKRASWSCVQVDAEGNKVASAHGTVPRHLPQTSQAGEFAALVAATRAAGGTCCVYGDCSNVVKSWTQPKSSWLQKGDVYGGVMQEARRANSEGFINDMQWVKAHQSISTLVKVASADAIRKAMGNDFADGKAKEGLLLHPQPEHVDKVVCDRMVKHTRQVCFLAAKILPLWPSMQRTDEVNKGPSTREVRKKRRRPHQWEPAVGRWHCGPPGTRSYDLGVS